MDIATILLLINSAVQFIAAAKTEMDKMSDISENDKEALKAAIRDAQAQVTTWE